MDIDQHVNQIVQGIVADITTKIQSQVADVINQKVAEAVNAIDYTPLLSEKLSQRIDAKLNQLPIDAKSVERELANRLNVAAQIATENVEQRTAIAVNDIVNNKINALDFRGEYQKTIISAVQNNLVTFPHASIDPDSIDLTKLSITGDQVVGGIITKFGSTGIEDLATGCQLTITDDVTVVENNLLTKDLTVKGTTTIEGDLNVTGSIPENSPMFTKFVNAATNNLRTSLDKSMFDAYAKTVLDKLRDEGITLDKITVNGQDVLNGSMLGNFITQSNLQTVGTLRELQVSGETFLAQTLYTSQKRVGINTIEPSNALSIWDQEIELGFGKLETNVAFMAAPRNQKLVLVSNNKHNLVLETDGSVTVEKINIGTMSISVGTAPPSDNRPKGTIVFNANPTLGGPLGWVSLGDARWANFGIID